MPRVALSEAEIQAFRERVCDGAAALFARQGYDAVTMRAIAEQVGCSPMTPYRYFADKADILAMIRARGHGRLADRLAAEAARATDPVERLRRLALVYVAFAQDETDSYRMMFQIQQEEDWEAYPDLATEGSRSWGEIRNAVGLAVDAGALEGDADTVAHCFWASTHGIVSLHLSGHLQMGKTLDDLIEPMFRMLLTGALAPSEGVATA